MPRSSPADDDLDNDDIDDEVSDVDSDADEQTHHGSRRQPVYRDPARIGGSHTRPLSQREYPIDTPDFTDDGTDPCPHCGKNIYADSEWCPHCGTYLSDEDTPASSRKRYIVAAVIGALLLITLIGALRS